MATTTTAEQKDRVHEYLAAWDDADPAALDGLLAEDFSTTYTDVTGEEIRLDKAGFQELMAGYLEAFSEPGHELHEMVAEDDRVMTRITYSVVHDGELYGIEPTGNRVEVEEFLSFRFADGDITSVDWLGDNLGLLRQLGVDLPIEA